MELKNFDSPDETRPFEGKGQAQVVNVGGRTIGKGVPAGAGATTSSRLLGPIRARFRTSATASRGG
jgi:hypothetical protein